MLSARELVHRYGGRPVLTIDRFDLEPGTITALVGPNGSGKSTLLRLLAFIERPSAGSLALGGAPVRTERERRRARRRVTLVEQHPLLFDTSVRANLAYPLRVRRRSIPDGTDRAADALRAVGAEHLADRQARELSGGETRRVAIARALMAEPDILLLDEPLSGIDGSFGARFGDVLSALHQRGATVCLSSHLLEAAYRWADHIVALADGRVGAATPENLFRVDIPEGGGARLVRAGPLELTVVTDRVGPATVAIPADDIVVSAAPLHSSARNQFTGRIIRIAEERRGRIALTVDVGAELQVRITPQSFTELELTIGSAVVLSIKAMAVQVI
ncbi:MAG TPA: ATP-binding cassette domain-containing protein [Gemmatimonadales bacterium]